MKRSLCAVMALTAAAQATAAQNPGFFQPAQRHAASYASIRPQSIAAGLEIHQLSLTEDSADERREAKEQRYDARVASKLLSTDEWAFGLNLESTQVEATAPIQKRSEIKLYGINPWISARLSSQLTFAFQQNLTVINEAEESFSGLNEYNTRQVNQGIASLAWRPAAGTELGLALADGYRKHDLRQAQRYALFGSTQNLLPALLGFELAALNYQALNSDLHDAYSLELFTAVPLSASTTLDSKIGYQTAASHKASTLDAQTAARSSLELGARYQLHENWMLGAAIAVETAVGEKEGTYVDQKDWSLQLQTQIAL